MIYHGHCLDVLRRLPANSYHLVVTSPPYYLQRDYNLPPTVWGGDASCAHEWGDASDRVLTRGATDPKRRAARLQSASNGQFCASCSAWRGCLGLEPTPALYVAHVVEVFQEVWRVLRPDGTLWLNLGDGFATNNGSGQATAQRGLLAASDRCSPRSRPRQRHQETDGLVPRAQKLGAPDGLKPKDLVGIPWMVAFALRDRGWYLRMDNVWEKTNPMPESVKDRPVKSHEYVFLLSKSESYYYDAHAVRETDSGKSAGNKQRKHRGNYGGAPHRPNNHQGFAVPWKAGGGRNLRSVWTFPTAPFKGAHFATFPPRLVRTPILAGTSAHGCCPRCGAGFKRMTRLGEELLEQKRAGGCNRDGTYHGTAQKQYSGTGAQDPSAVKRRILEGMRDRVTVGWRPTCRCGGMRIRPGAHSRRMMRAWYRDRWQARIDARWGGIFGHLFCARVLDPFGGSGTTLRVALKLGRDADIIELNPHYIAMAQPSPTEAVS